MSKVAAFLLCCMLVPALPAQASPAPLKVLFIGNSYTYYHRMPDIVAAMAATRESPRRFEVRMVAQGGASLFSHWENGAARRALRSGRWDVVVLQDRSLVALDQPDELNRYAERFADAARSAGARVVLYATWARRDRPETQARLNDAFATAARASRSELAPVGAAWEQALRRWPDVALHDADGSHPAGTGSYLAACVIYIVAQPDADTCPALADGDRDDLQFTGLRAVAAQAVKASRQRAQAEPMNR